MIQENWFGPLAIGLALALASGCGAEDGALTEDIGQVGIYLSSVPSNGTCLRFTTTAGSRSIQQSFDAVPGGPLVAALHGLPYGVTLSTSAEAFDGACDAVTPTSLATYLSDTAVMTLTPGETRNLTFTLRPTGNVNGTAEFVLLAITPAAQNFGSVPTGREGGPLSFTAKNVSMIPTSVLSASISDATSGGPQFTIASSSCDTELEPSATCTVQVKMTPTTIGSKSATFQVTGTTGGTATASLTGTGINPARIFISPPSRDFGNVPLGGTFPSSGGFTLFNTGDEATGTLTVALSPPNPDFSISPSTSCSVIGKGSSCPLTVLFAPTTVGLLSTTLTVSGNPGGSVSATIKGTGISPLTTSPTSADLGSSPVGVAGSSQVFVIRNASLQSSAALTVAASSADFRVTSDNCSGKNLAGFSTCNVTVQLQPTAAGALSGTLTVNGATGWTAQATLTGSGI